MIETRGKAIPTIIATACADAAVEINVVARCSGRYSDMRRRVEERVCALFDMTAGRVDGQKSIEFKILRSGPNLPRLSIEEDGVIKYDHLITESWAQQFEARYRTATRG